MKLLDLIFGKKKHVQHVEQKQVAAPLQCSASKNPKPSKHSCADTSRSVFRGCNSHDTHDFSGSYPFRCRKCGLVCNGTEEEIARFLKHAAISPIYKYAAV